MNYSKIHDSIISRAQSRNIDNTVYTEKHHIIPLCICNNTNCKAFNKPRKLQIKHTCGLDDKDNIVDLLEKEHFVIHHLLTKIYRKHASHYKLIHAFRMMLVKNQKRESKYKISKSTRELFIQSLKKDSRIRNSNERNGMFGKKHSIESINKMINNRKGKGKFSKERKQTQRQNMIGRIWYNNGTDSIRIRKNDPIPEGYNKGRINSLKSPIIRSI
jgi:hypothetical protein